MKRVQVISIVGYALDTINSKLPNMMEKSKVNVKFGHLQKTTLLRTSQIIMKICHLSPLIIDNWYFGCIFIKIVCVSRCNNNLNNFVASGLN